MSPQNWNMTVLIFHGKVITLKSVFCQLQLQQFVEKDDFFVFYKYPTLAITRDAVREGGPRKSHQEGEEWK